MKTNPTGAAGGEGAGIYDSVLMGIARVVMDRGLFQGGRKSGGFNRPFSAPIQQKIRLASHSAATGEIIEP
ncbi:MAG: hypothetical protein ACKV19_25460 [Verrucomicrobiales bacterium]